MSEKRKHKIHKIKLFLANAYQTEDGQDLICPDWAEHLFDLTADEAALKWSLGKFRGAIKVELPKKSSDRFESITVDGKLIADCYRNDILAVTGGKTKFWVKIKAK